MKKKIAMAIAAGVMAVSLMTACGGGSDSGGATEATTKAAAATEAAVSKDSAAADSTGDVSYVDGYYANDGNGNDFIIAFYEGAAGDVAYVNDGTNEALAEYTVENAETSEGEAYLLITVGNTTLGYIADGDTYYIIDDEGNTYEAAKLSEEEADGIYAALKAADSGAGEEAGESDTGEAGEVSYVDGYYANNGDGSDFIIAFYEGAAGDVAYVNDGTNEALAEYTVENAETSEGEAYLLITVGNTTLGYIADGDSYYIVDDEGNVYGAAKLSEEEANTIYAALTEAAN